MSKLVAALSAVAILLLTGCFAPDSGSDDASDESADGGTSSTDQGDATPGDNEVGTPDESNGGGSSDGGDDDKGGDEGKGDDDSAGSDDETAPPTGPCDAVVPYEEVSGLIPDPAAGSMSNGGDIISQCEWVSADGNQSLVVSARDAALIGATGVEKAYRKKAIKNLGEEAGSRIKTGNASVQVYAMVKGSGKAQPVLYTVTWKGEDVEIDALKKIAQRIV